MSQEQELLKEILDRFPSAMLAFTPEFEVIWVNATTAALAPQLVPAANIYEALAEAAPEEKLDRMLLRGERVMFSAGPGLPLLEWVVADRGLNDGNSVLIAWDPDLSDELVERRATFSMAAAHELKSPLTALIGFSEILEMERGNLTALQKEAAAMIRTNSLYLQSLVNDMSDLMANSFGELRLDLEQTDIAATVREVITSLSARIDDRDQKLSVEIEPGLPLVEADGRRIRQALQNLVHNAHVHCGPGTEIKVAARVDDGGIVITVDDDGPGLPFENPEEAFASFRHAGTIDTEELTGSGIGLTLTKRIIELHRGTVSAESPEGGGTRFRIWLPLDRARTFTLGTPGPA